MPAKSGATERVHAEIRYADGAVEIIDVENPSTTTIEAIVRLGRLKSGAAVVGSSLAPAVNRSTDLSPPSSIERTAYGLRAPKWQAIRDWLLSRGEGGGFEHTTIELHLAFLGRQLSFVEPGEKPIAKTTGTNHRKARNAIAARFGGHWVGDPIGPRNRSGTTRWRLVRD